MPVPHSAALRSSSLAFVLFSRAAGSVPVQGELSLAPQIGSIGQPSCAHPEIQSLRLHSGGQGYGSKPGRHSVAVLNWPLIDWLISFPSSPLETSYISFIKMGLVIKQLPSDTARYKHIALNRLLCWFV